MEKKIIIFFVIILGFICYNYPIFNSESISYLLIFICFTAITFSVAKIFNPTDENSYDSVEKKADELQNFDGIFRYTKGGFSFLKDGKTEIIKWKEIIEVNFFSIPFLDDERHTGLEIITEKMSYELNQEQTPGIEKLTDQLIKNLSHWNFDVELVKTNNYGLKKANHFKI